jgi:hypothetical protein
MNLGPDWPVIRCRSQPAERGTNPLGTAGLRAHRERLQHLCPFFPARPSVRRGGNLLRPLRRDCHLRPARQGFPARRGGVGTGPQMPAAGRPDNRAGTERPGSAGAEGAAAGQQPPAGYGALTALMPPPSAGPGRPTAPARGRRGRSRRGIRAGRRGATARRGPAQLPAEGVAVLPQGGRGGPVAAGRADAGLRHVDRVRGPGPAGVRIDRAPLAETVTFLG